MQARSTRGHLILISGMLISGLALLGWFEVRWSHYRDARVRGEAAQWALTTAYLLDRFFEVYGYYCACGGDEPPCWSILGWVDYPEHADTFPYDLSVQVADTGYVVIAETPDGTWRLVQGEALRWEGSPGVMPAPRDQIQKQAEKQPWADLEGPDLPSP